MTGADIIARIKKQPVGFACALICVLCLGWLYGLRGGALEKRQQEYDTIAGQAKLESSNVTLAKSLPEQVTELQAATKELESRLIKAGQLAVNLQYFYKLEAETDVKVLDVRPGTLPRAGKTIYTGVPFNVNIQGTYKNVMAFLQRVENGRHFCRINSATFSKSAGSSEGGSQGGGGGITLALSLELLGQP